MAKHKISFVSVIILSGILSLYSYSFLSINVKLILIPFIIMTIVYNLDAKWLPINKLRSNGIIKIMVVAMVWTGLIIIAPYSIYLSNDEQYIAMFLRSLFIFVFVLMLTMSFDQRDLLIDGKDLKTLPQLYQKKLFYFYVVFNVLLTLIAFEIFKTREYLFIAILMINLSTYLCIKSNETKSYYYTAFWIEALPILWFCLICLR